MERKLVYFTTIFTCVFSLFACASVWFLPSIEHSVEAFAAGILQSRQEREERYAMLEKMSGLEIMNYNTQQAQQQEQEEQQAQVEDGGAESVKTSYTDTLDSQMRLELPAKTGGADVEIVPDSINRKIHIVIPGADENYLYDYQIIGKSDEIENLDYINEGSGGTIELTMNKLVAFKSGYDEDYFYLEFLSLEEAYDRLVVVDAGHGGKMPGAVSGDKYEKNITLAIVQQMKALFDGIEDSRIGVFYTRLDDTNPDLSSRVGLANDLGADLFVSIHINSLKGNANVEGVEVMYNELAADTAFDSKDFAQICLDEEAKASGAKKRRLVAGNRIHIIRNAKMPAALVEVGFMNNPRELAKMLDPSYQQKAAQGIYNAVIKSLEQLDEIEGK